MRRFVVHATYLEKGIVLRKMPFSMPVLYYLVVSFMFRKSMNMTESTWKMKQPLILSFPEWMISAISSKVYIPSSLSQSNIRQNTRTFKVSTRLAKDSYFKRFPHSFASCHIPLTLIEFYNVVNLIPDSQTRNRMFWELSSTTTDNLKLLQELCYWQNEYAGMIGHKSYAEYEMNNTLLKTPGEVVSLIDGMFKGLRPAIDERIQRIQRIK